jgi:hypothetical protein
MYSSHDHNTKVVVFNGVEGGVRREQKLTGEAVTTARWFRWKSGHEEWPGSVSRVRESSPAGRSGQWEADGGGPR